ncbi:hypothetical protein MTX37_28460 [Rhodococcus sp. ARC_M8]|uniref:hypothetical protein n=1 Tax=Rhodococcus TaxID=1827 RepID=UPI001FB3CDAE|nr:MULTISPECIES: hypothetical protein [Rhodococcus]MCJ0949857.1 hypothetical protein [Rhodococcus sp. ARC_M8]MDJ0441274.1 hypothetical protein [Rhodococcus qingshengii]
MAAGIQATRVGGRIVNLGMRAGWTVELRGIPLKERDLFSCSIGMVPIDVRARAFGDLSQLALTGGIHVESERTALADVAERWKRQETSHTASCSSHLEGGPRLSWWRRATIV